MIMLPQLHTSGGYISGDEYVYIGSLDVSVHLDSLKTQLWEIMDIKDKYTALKVEVINVHGGVDRFAHEESECGEFYGGWREVVEEFKGEWEGKFR